MSIICYFLFLILFENFQISQSDQCNFDYPQLTKIMKEQLCYKQMNPPQNA